jgi:hypothetical protein
MGARAAMMTARKMAALDPVTTTTLANAWQRIRIAAVAQQDMR